MTAPMVTGRPSSGSRTSTTCDRVTPTAVLVKSSTMSRTNVRSFGWGDGSVDDPDAKGFHDPTWAASPRTFL